MARIVPWWAPGQERTAKIGRAAANPVAEGRKPRPETSAREGTGRTY